MRLVLTMLLLAGSAASARAQSDDFNPYQAVLDRMPLADVEPLIVAAYGAITDRTKGLLGYEDDSVLVLRTTGEGDQQPIFLFCHDIFAGVSAVMTTKVVADILAPLTLSTSPPLDVFASNTDLTLTTDDRQLIAVYWGIGTKESSVIVSYPWEEAFLHLDLPVYCAKFAD